MDLKSTVSINCAVDIYACKLWVKVQRLVSNSLFESFSFESQDKCKNVCTQAVSVNLRDKTDSGRYDDGTQQ